jgi:hypothetical protein
MALSQKIYLEAEQQEELPLFLSFNVFGVHVRVECVCISGESRAKENTTMWCLRAALSSVQKSSKT